MSELILAGFAGVGIGAFLLIYILAAESCEPDEELPTSGVDL